MLNILETVSATVSCSDKNLANIVTFTKNVMSLLEIAAPVIIIIGGSIDFAKAVMAQKEEDIGKAKHTFLNRILMACGVFLLLAFMKLINNILIAAGVQSDWLSCWGLK